ncbi:MAG: hypothetical protein A2787_09800 [Omnitrophica WOR_2 bacterium RIFCSPHIGHO2_01_FULL_48_9]|nr:MAG: hypothetical protein A2787_09800 [Omnitrophica WOR_2 bacterium RIFCSPHIGHO2_01_FULL_48_9]
MKGCFLLQRNFSKLGHAIALELKAKYGVTEFCGYTQMRRAERFLKSREDLRWDPLLVDDDLQDQAANERLDLHYLALLEKEYGLPEQPSGEGTTLWPYLINDRHLMMGNPTHEFSYTPLYTHEEMLKTLQAKFRAVVQMLKEKKPDFAVFSAIGSVGSFALYQVAKKMGIKTIVIEHTLIKNRITLTNSCYNQFTGINGIFDRIRSGNHKSPFREEAVKFLETYRAKPAKYAGRDFPHKSFFSFQRFARSVRLFFKHLVIYLREKKSDYQEESPFSYLRNRLLKKWRALIGYRDLYSEPNIEGDFALYPLQEEPEIALSLLAPFYTDQVGLIRNIAKSLPVHFKLYVKEHPVMINRRSRLYYKELLNIPNVQLIDVHYPSIKLAQNAKIIFTITGTPGWEGILFKKPVITFGSVGYNKLSMAHKAGRMDELPILVKHALENHVHDEEELIDFISAAFEYSFPFDYYTFWHKRPFEEFKDDPELKKFVRFLFEKELKDLANAS